MESGRVGLGARSEALAATILRNVLNCAHLRNRRPGGASTRTGDPTQPHPQARLCAPETAERRLMPDKRGCFEAKRLYSAHVVPVLPHPRTTDGSSSVSVDVRSNVADVDKSWGCFNVGLGAALPRWGRSVRLVLRQTAVAEGEDETGCTRSPSFAEECRMECADAIAARLLKLAAALRQTRARSLGRWPVQLSPIFHLPL